MNYKNKQLTYKITLFAMFLALSIILPFFTGRIYQFGKMFSPMHIPILLCGFILGPIYGLILGFFAPLLNSIFFGMPALYPNAICMSFELASYGFISGLLYKIFNKKERTNQVFNIYISLIIAMICGRLIWGISQLIFSLFTHNAFTWSLFLSGVFLYSWPGIIVQIILIPTIVFILNKSNFLKRLNND